MDYFDIYRFPVVIIGDTMSGKSTLIGSFANDEFYHVAEPTVGVDFFTKVVELEDGVKVRLQLWDTAGQEKYRAIMKSYYRKAMEVLLAYDITCKWSFFRLEDWLQEAKTNICNDVIYQVIGCKCDLEHKREVSTQEGKDFANKHGIKFIETSAKKRHNLNEAFATIAGAILEKVEVGEIEATKITPNDPLAMFAGKLNRRLSKKECRLCRFA